MIEAAQIRAARALLDMQQKQLAELAGVALKTVKRAERGIPVSAETQAAIRQALERRGVEFIPEDGGGPGVRRVKGGRRRRA